MNARRPFADATMGRGLRGDGAIADEELKSLWSKRSCRIDIRAAR
jgi:hypothetical protein